MFQEINRFMHKYYQFIKVDRWYSILYPKQLSKKYKKLKNQYHCKNPCDRIDNNMIRKQIFILFEA